MSACRAGQLVLQHPVIRRERDGELSELERISASWKSPMIPTVGSLSELRKLWGFRYEINCVADWWTAKKRGDPMVFLETNDPEKLLFMIRDDYFGRT
jgi:hypothetical protein